MVQQNYWLYQAQEKMVNTEVFQIGLNMQMLIAFFFFFPLVKTFTMGMANPRSEANLYIIGLISMTVFKYVESGF